MSEKKKKVVVFDFDGTIVNSMEAFADIAAEVMPKYLPIDGPTARRRYLETSGLPFFQQLEVMFPGHEANRQTAEEFEKRKLENYFESPLFNDALETVTHLRQQGIKVVVSSNNFQELVHRFIEDRGMEFDMALGYKPNFAKGTEHFEHIIKQTGCKPNEMTFVGDSLKDAERAREFGIDFIGKEGIFTTDQFKQCSPQATVVAQLSELKEKIP